MAEWVALPSISGGPRGPFRDLRGPGKGMVGGDWGPDQGAAEEPPLPRGFANRSPGSAGPLRHTSPRRQGSPRRPGEGQSLTTLPPRCTADPALTGGGGGGVLKHHFGGKASSSGTKPGTHPTHTPRPGLSLRAPSPAAGLQAEGWPRLPGQRWERRAGCPSFPVALLSRSQRAVQ